MKKLIAIALLAIFTAACTPTENAGMMDKGMMCEKWSATALPVFMRLS